MQAALRALAILLLSVAGLAASAAHTQVRLVLSADTVRPGDTVLAGVDLKMDPGWHTYWQNPGEAGMATKVQWQLPSGVTAGEIQWPLPEKLPPAEVTTYGYNDEVMLVVPLKFAADCKPGPLELKADVSWLECKTECIPGNTGVAATINVAAETKASARAALIQFWQSKAPTTNGLPLHAWWETPATNDERPLIIASQGTPAARNVTYDSIDLFPAASSDYEVEPAVQVISASSSDIRLRKVVKKYAGDWPKESPGSWLTKPARSATAWRWNCPLPVNRRRAMLFPPNHPAPAARPQISPAKRWKMARPLPRHPSRSGKCCSTPSSAGLSLTSCPACCR